MFVATHHRPGGKVRSVLQHRVVGNGAAQWEHGSSGDDEPIRLFPALCDVVNLHRGPLVSTISAHARVGGSLGKH